MASSGTVTLSTQSVDYGGGRGYVKLTNIIRYYVDDNGVISFSSESSSDNVGGSWWICGTASWYGITLEPQVSYDGGGSWVSLDNPFQAAGICPDGTNTISASIGLIGRLRSYQLTGNCQLRFLYYANAAPAPTPSLPNAFPNSSYSAAVQVPVHIDVSWNASVTYNKAGGTGGPNNESRVVSGDSTNFTVGSAVPTRANHRFNGWEYGGRLYRGGDTVTVYRGNPSITLTASWTEYYRPGQRKISGTWRSHNRNGGVCDRKGYGEMKTLGGGVETGDPPRRKASNTWYNMRRVGAE